MSESKQKKGTKQIEAKSAKKDKSKKSDNSDAPDNSIIPEKLRFYVSQEIWSMWSPIRRESFKMIIKNPNTFFYRNRPPGDPQKCGPFTSEEEEQFLKRLKYFREELKIQDGLWGFFSVPIRGRVGYQCSNFYRLLIKAGKVVDDHYELQEDGKLKFIKGQTKETPSPEVMQLLEKEAFDFIKQCMTTEDGVVPQVSMPIQVTADNTTRPVFTKPYKIKRASKEIVNFIGHERNLRERKSIQDTLSNGAKNAGINTNLRTLHACFDRNHSCPLYGATDPMTKEPIEVPMMDPSGFVMDLKSWRRVFRHNEMPPCQFLANDENDLIEINPKNFNHFRSLITNIIC